MIGGTSPPPYVVFSANASDKNYEIVICSKIVPRSCSKAFGMDKILQSLWVRAVSYAPGAYKVFTEGVAV